MATARKPAASKKAAPKRTTKPAVKKSAVKKPAPRKKPVAKKPVVKKPVAKKPEPKKPAAKKPVPREKASQPPASAPRVQRSSQGFKVNEFVVYPAHGVGQITEISKQEIANVVLKLFVIHFAKEKMVLRVPLPKAKAIGMRKIANAALLEKAMKTLRGRARVKRTMWSRRAQEYSAKINSGDLVAIAEVVRDLFRNENQREQSYSERQIYEGAMERMAREVAIIRKTTDDQAIEELEAVLAETTGAPRRKPASIL